MGERFSRDRVRHELAVRRIRVLRTEDVAAGMRRVTFGGDDLAGFAAEGPADHVKLFLPDPETGILTVPQAGKFREPSPDGARVIVRDYTPLAFRPAGANGPELDIDFVLHGDHGVAAAWAAQAKPGDELAIGGPRGSALVPTGIESLVLVADESALPAAARWLRALGDDIPVTALFAAADPDTARYFADASSATRQLRWFTGVDRHAHLEDALRGAPIDEGTYLFLAGEATALIPLRRHLRRELGLPKSQVEVHGYWKQGIAALDHHAPLDPSDPDE